MNKIKRLLQYMVAKRGLADFNRTTEALVGRPETIFPMIWDYAGGYFRPIQQDSEFIELARRVWLLQPKVILEIGTHWGGTLHMWTRMATEDATIISVDLPGGEFGGGYSEIRIPLYESFRRPSQQLHLLREDSHSPETLAKVKNILSGRPVDFLLIDGDHTYSGVKQDFEMYTPLVRKGGLIAFHDIAKSYDRTEVEKFWNEVKVGRSVTELCHHPSGIYGIGIIEVESDPAS